jgi:hypothetical protein
MARKQEKVLSTKINFPPEKATVAYLVKKSPVFTPRK